MFKVSTTGFFSTLNNFSFNVTVESETPAHHIKLKPPQIKQKRKYNPYLGVLMRNFLIIFEQIVIYQLIYELLTLSLLNYVICMLIWVTWVRGVHGSNF